MIIDIENGLEKILGIVKNPEDFLLEKYYGSTPPRGFRIDLFAAQRFTAFYENVRQLGKTRLNVNGAILDNERMINSGLIKKFVDFIKGNPQKTFCQYCEKVVVPRTSHKLDYADIVLFFFTGGFWAALILAMRLFMRRCPFCDQSLRGVKRKPVDNKTNTRR